MSQQSLWIDSWTDAVRALVDAAGGPKRVGAQLRPELPVDDAADWLLKTLNPKRREVMTAADLIDLLKIGRACGCDVLMAFVAEQAAYERPKPLDLQTEVGHTAQAVNQLMGEVNRYMERLTRLQAQLQPQDARRA